MSSSNVNCIWSSTSIIYLEYFLITAWFSLTRFSRWNFLKFPPVSYVILFLYLLQGVLWSDSYSRIRIQVIHRDCFYRTLSVPWRRVLHGSIKKIHNDSNGLWRNNGGLLTGYTSRTATANENLASAEARPARLRHVHGRGRCLTSHLQGEPMGKESCTLAISW